MQTTKNVVLGAMGSSTAGRKLPRSKEKFLGSNNPYSGGRSRKEKISCWYCEKKDHCMREADNISIAGRKGGAPRQLVTWNIQVRG